MDLSSLCVSSQLGRQVFIQTHLTVVAFFVPCYVTVDPVPASQPIMSSFNQSGRESFSETCRASSSLSANQTSAARTSGSAGLKQVMAVQSYLHK